MGNLFTIQHTSEKVPDSFTWTIQGFVNREDQEAFSDTGWGASTPYEKGAGEGLYPIYMTGVSDRSVDGNYIIHLIEGGLAVDKDTVALNDVRQLNGFGPDDGDFYTGVDPVTKTYDGEEAYLELKVTWPEAANSDWYTVKYSTGDGKTWSTKEPTVTSAGKHKVWYAFEPTEKGKKQIFATTNYQYITIRKRPITLTSASATKSYDGTPLTAETVTVAGEGIASKDTIAYTFKDGQTTVGWKDNAFEYKITGVGSEDDYDITVVTGKLTVTPGKMTINGVEQPDDPKFPLDQGKTGVADVVKNYDGVPTNLVVKVDSPAGATVLYKLATTDWVESLSLVEVGEYVVHYKVEWPNYATVQNFGRVIIKPAVATALAIVDHCDAGNGKVHLAFRPVVAGGLTKEYVLALAANNGLAAVFGADEASLATAKPVSVTLRDPTGELDLDKGLVWVTVDVAGKARPLYCKIVILEARQDR